MSWSTSRIFQPDANPANTIKALTDAGEAGVAAFIPMLGNPINQYVMSGHSQDKPLRSIVEAFSGKNTELALQVNRTILSDDSWHTRVMLRSETNDMSILVQPTMNMTPHVPGLRAPYVTADRISSSSESKEHYWHNYAIGAQFETDHLRAPGGKEYFDLHLSELTNSIRLHVRLATHVSLMKSKAEYLLNVTVNGQPFTSVYHHMQVWADFFAILNRDDNGAFRLVNQVRGLFERLSRSFDEIILPSGCTEQIVYGSSKMTEAFRQGLDADIITEMGQYYITYISGFPVSIENTTLFKGAKDIEYDLMKRNHVTGCYWVSDNSYIDRIPPNTIPSTKNERAVGYIEVDVTDETVRTIEVGDMIESCVAFDSSDFMLPLRTEGLNDIAKHFQSMLTNLDMKVPVTPAGDPMLDPFIFFANSKDSASGRVCRFWGDQDEVYFRNSLLKTGTSMNKELITRQIGADNISKIRAMLALANTAYAAGIGNYKDAGSMVLQAFAQAIVETNGINNDTQSVNVNDYGVPNLPPLIPGVPAGPDPIPDSIRFVMYRRTGDPLAPAPGEAPGRATSSRYIYVADRAGSVALAQNPGLRGLIVNGQAIAAGDTVNRAGNPIPGIPADEVLVSRQGTRRAFVTVPGHGMPPGYSTFGHMLYLAQMHTGAVAPPAGWANNRQFMANVKVIHEGVEACELYFSEVDRLFGIPEHHATENYIDLFQNLYLRPDSVPPDFSTPHPVINKKVSVFSNTVDTLKFPLSVTLDVGAPRGPLVAGMGPAAEHDLAGIQPDVPNLVSPARTAALKEAIAAGIGRALGLAERDAIERGLQLWGENQGVVGGQRDLLEDLLNGGTQFARRYEQAYRDGLIDINTVSDGGMDHGDSPWWFLLLFTFSDQVFPRNTPVTLDNTNAIQKTIALWRNTHNMGGIRIDRTFLDSATVIPEYLRPVGNFVSNAQEMYNTGLPRPRHTEYFNLKISVDPSGFSLGSRGQNAFLYIQPLRPNRPLGGPSDVLAPISVDSFDAATGAPDHAAIATALTQLRTYAHAHAAGQLKHAHSTYKNSSVIGGAPQRNQAIGGASSRRGVRPQRIQGHAFEAETFRPDTLAHDNRTGYGLLNPAILTHITDSRFYAMRVALADEYLKNDPIQRSLMLLLCGTPIYGRKLVDWAENNMLVPLSFIPAAPFIKLSTDAAYFVTHGSGTMLFAYHEMDVAFETTIKLMYVDSNYFLNAFIKDEKDNMIHDAVRFSGFGSGLRLEWMTRFRHSSKGSEIPDFDIKAVDDRRGNFFCLYMGASQTESDLGNGGSSLAIDLSGKHDLNGIHRADYGQEAKEVMSFQTFPCALMFNWLTAYGNVSAGHYYTANTYEQIFQFLGTNSCCYRGTQFSYRGNKRDPIRTHYGAGPLRGMRTGIRSILNGGLGHFEPTVVAGVAAKAY